MRESPCNDGAPLDEPDLTEIRPKRSELEHSMVARQAEKAVWGFSERRIRGRARMRGASLLRGRG